MMSPTIIYIRSREVCDDIRSAAWLESEIHRESNLHQRHEMADICEKDNVERVWRVLALSMAEITHSLKGVLTADDKPELDNSLEHPSSWILTFRNRLDPHVAGLLKEKIHEYLVARVMADRLDVLIPAAACGWKGRADDILCSITVLAQTEATFAPVVRPLWPL